MILTRTERNAASVEEHDFLCNGKEIGSNKVKKENRSFGPSLFACNRGNDSEIEGMKFAWEINNQFIRGKTRSCFYRFGKILPPLPSKGFWGLIQCSKAIFLIEYT